MSDAVSAQQRTAHRAAVFRRWAFILPALLWTAAFFVVPLLIMGVYSFWQRVGTRLVTDLTLVNYDTFFERTYFVGSLLNSLEVTVITTIVSVVLAYPLAYILAYQVPRQWQRVALLVAIVPFWTSYVVRSYSWLLVLAKGGVVNGALMSLGIIDEPLVLTHHRGATIVGFVHFFTMMLTLTIYANLVQISPNYSLAASDLGASRLQTFLRITLPLSLPGVMVGAYLTFVLAIGDYATPQILGGFSELLMPQAIILQVQRHADFPMAAAMSMVLMVVVTLVFAACARWLKMDRV